MTCREFAAFLDDYLAGTLPPAQRAEFEHHLGICRDCVVYLDGYRRTVQAVRALRGDGDAVPDDVPEDLVQAILQARKRT